MIDALGDVYGHCVTESDYSTGLYYDPAVYSRFVEGNFQSENFRLLADGYSEGYADWYPAEVGFRYTRPIGNEYYNTDSVHYVIDYYYGGRRVVAHTYHTIRFPPPADECQQGQSFTSNGAPCETPSPSPSPSPTATPASGYTFRLSLDRASTLPNEVPGSTKVGVRVETTPAQPNKTVQLSVYINPTSGRHDGTHTGQRPLGLFGKERGTTNGSGVFETTYTPPIFAGYSEIIAAMDNNAAMTEGVRVEVTGLVELGAGGNYRLRGGTASHPAPLNRYGTPEANAGLIGIAQDYRNTFYLNKDYPDSEKIWYNDQSLPFGGKFDIDHNWSPAHARHDEHRTGINCDVPAEGFIPEWRDRQRRLLEIFFERGSTRTHDELATGNHWHLRFEFGTPQEAVGRTLAVADFVPETIWGAMNRAPSEAEAQDWMSRLTSAQTYGQEALLTEAKTMLRAQFQSAEYTNRNRTDEEFVTDLYVAYHLTEPDSTSFEQSLNALRSDTAQGLNGRERLRQSFENSAGFAGKVGALEGTYEPPVCDIFQEQDCYNNGGSWDASTCSCTNYNPDPCWNGSYYTCE